MAKLDHDAYDLRVRAGGFAPRTLHLRRTSRPIYQEVDVVLAPETSVAGVVRDVDGKPIEGVVVSVTNVMAIDGRGYTDTERPEAKTDGDGRFQLDRLPTGFVQLSYYKPGYYHTPLGELRTLPGKDEIEIAMVRTGKISGRIVDPKVKAASAGANAMLESVSSQWGNWGGGMTADAEIAAVGRYSSNTTSTVSPGLTITSLDLPPLWRTARRRYWPGGTPSNTKRPPGPRATTAGGLPKSTPLNGQHGASWAG